MHQSIPAVPIPPPGNRGAFTRVVSPGVGAFAILSQSRGLGISIPRGNPRAFDTCFLKTYKIVGKDEAFVKDWLVHKGPEKLVDVFQGMFSKF